jgi:hypothetical protein
MDDRNSSVKPAPSSLLAVRWGVSLIVAFAATFFRSSPLFNPAGLLDEIALVIALALSAGFICYLAFPILERGISFAFSARGAFLFAWVIGGINAYFLTAFFRHFYPAPFQEILLTVIFVTLGGFAFYESILALRKIPVSHLLANWPSLAVLLLAGGLALAVIYLCFQFPEVFDRSLYLLDISTFQLFLITTLLSGGLLGWFLSFWEQNRPAASFRTGRVYSFIYNNVSGILLALLFFAAYFCLATVVNFPGYQTVDLFFDSDSSLWLIRMAGDPSATNPVRGAHPYVLIILRTLTWVGSLFLNGNRTFAAFAVNSGAGALCVFFTWRFFQRLTANSAYALMWAALLGASVSHLMFSSFLETYIFSALALIIFLNFLLADNRSLPAMIVTGVIVFGITVTNLAQTVFTYFLANPKIKSVLKYTLAVVLLAVGLSIAQAWIFHGTRVFFIPSNLLSEQKFGVELTGENSWRLNGRILLLARSLFIYNVVASKPILLSQELGTPFPNFRTFYASKGVFSFSSYNGLSDALVKIWMLLVIIAALAFLWNVIKSSKSSTSRFSMAMIICLGFNGVLHFTYGDDPLLYSADWTYALIFFIGLSLQRWANRKWLNVILLFFLALLIANNLPLFENMLTVSAPLFPLK